MTTDEKAKLTAFLIEHHTAPEESLRAKIADMLRFNRESNSPDEPALTLYNLLNDGSDRVINRALVSLHYNCQNLSDTLWGELIVKVDSLYESDNPKIRDGVLFFYGNVRSEKLDKHTTLRFVEKILANFNNDDKEIRRRAVWSLEHISERIPLSEHQKVLDRLIELAKVDRSIPAENLAKIIINLRGKITPELQELVSDHIGAEKRKMEKYEELRIEQEFKKYRDK